MFSCFAAFAGCAHHAVDTKKSETRLELAKEHLGRAAKDGSEQDLEEAEVEAEKALRYNPKSEVAYLILGLADFLRGINDFVLLEQRDCLTGVDAEVLRDEMDQRFNEADGHFAEAVKLAPDYGEAWSKRGLVALELGDYDRAVQYFQRAFQGRRRLEDLGLTRAHLGWARFHQGRMAEAAKELRQALQFRSGMCVAKYRLGRVYFARKEWNKALEQFRGVVKDSACRLQEAHLYLLKTLNELDMTQDLGEAARECVALAPRSCMARACRLAAAK